MSKKKENRGGRKKGIKKKIGNRKQKIEKIK